MKEASKKAYEGRCKGKGGVKEGDLGPAEKKRLIWRCERRCRPSNNNHCWEANDLRLVLRQAYSALLRI
jgi:hypothetical protein